MKKIIFILITSSSIISLTSLTGCINKTPEDPNTYIRTFIYDNLERTYRIHIPQSLHENPSPSLIFVLHGGGGTGEGMERTLTLGGFNKIADENKIIVIYPDGIEKHWNDGRNINDTAHQQNIDDVGFLSTLIDSLIDEFNVDSNCIFLKIIEKKISMKNWLKSTLVRFLANYLDNYSALIICKTN